MSSPDNPHDSIPPIIIPPTLSDPTNPDADNPYGAPQLFRDSVPLPKGPSAPLGTGYWICLALSAIFIALLLVAENWPFAIPVAWVLGSAAIRVPLRDVRRRSLNRPPTHQRMLNGAGDYILSSLLCGGLAVAMSTVFFTVCTVTGIGMAAMEIPDTSFVSIALGLGALASLVTYLFFFALSLRI